MLTTVCPRSLIPFYRAIHYMGYHFLDIFDLISKDFTDFEIQIQGILVGVLQGGSSELARMDE